MTLPFVRAIVFAVDLPALCRFYGEVLGLPHIVGTPAEGWVEYGGGGAAIALHSGGKPNDTRGSIKLSFGTPDVEGMRAALMARGARFGEIVTFGEIHLADGTDPEGNRIQLSNRGYESFITAQPAGEPLHLAPAIIDMQATPPHMVPIPVASFDPLPPSTRAQASEMPTPAPWDVPPPKVLNTDSPIAAYVRQSLQTNPDVFLYTMEERPGLAIIFRDFMTRLNHARPQAIPQRSLEQALAALGGVGMMARVGQRHRRIVAFPHGALTLAHPKQPLPGALELVTGDEYPLG